MKLLVIGHGRHGKDTLCEVLRDEFGMNFVSSSEFCAKNVVWPVMKHCSYLNWEECYNDRHNHREEWFNIIADYNKHEPDRLAKAILEKHDIYCGMRNIKEFEVAVQHFDLVVWVENPRLVDEDISSFSIPREEADFVIVNDGTKKQFQRKVRRVFSEIIN